MGGRIKVFAFYYTARFFMKTVAYNEITVLVDRKHRGDQLQLIPKYTFWKLTIDN